MRCDLDQYDLRCQEIDRDQKNDAVSDYTSMTGWNPGWCSDYYDQWKISSEGAQASFYARRQYRAPAGIPQNRVYYLSRLYAVKIHAERANA